MSAAVDVVVALGEMFLRQPLAAALLVILYLQYELRHGALARYFHTLDGMVAVVIALAEQVDGVDSDTVADRLNGDNDSSTFLTDDAGDADDDGDAPLWQRDDW